MSKPAPRHYTLQRDFERQLANCATAEAIEILARTTARILAREPSQFAHYARVFKVESDREYAYLTAKHREASAQ